jgi:hypothetical protein
MYIPTVTCILAIQPSFLEHLRDLLPNPRKGGKKLPVKIAGHPFISPDYPPVIDLFTPPLLVMPL